MTDKTQADEHIEANEAQIAVYWKEEQYFQPPKEFVEQANMHDPHIRKRLGEENFSDCFKEYADMLTWSKPYRMVLDTNNPPFWKWFTGGKHECMLQLRRSSSRAVPQQSSIHAVAFLSRPMRIGVQAI